MYFSRLKDVRLSVKVKNTATLELKETRFLR